MKKEYTPYQLAYHAYCKHVADGNPKYGFYFEHVTQDFTLSVNWKSLEEYMAANGNQFDLGLLSKAKAIGFHKWFTVGKDLAFGIPKRHANTVLMLWQNVMKNLFRDEYGWEGEQKQELIVRTAADEILDKMHAKQEVDQTPEILLNAIEHKPNKGAAREKTARRLQKRLDKENKLIAKDKTKLAALHVAYPNLLKRKKEKLVASGDGQEPL